MPSEPGGFVVRDHSAAEPAGREHDAARADGAAVLADDAHAAPVDRPQARPRARPRGPRCAGPRRRRRTAGARRGGRSRCRPRGRRGAGCGPPSSPSARLPWRSASKCTPSALEVADDARRLAAQDGGRAGAHEAAPGALGVAAVQVGRVVVGERRREPALGPVARRPGQRRGADERDARARRGRPSAPRTGPPRRRRRRRRRPSMRSGGMAGYRTRDRVPVLLRHPSSLEHDTGPHPERIARIVAIERELAARDWLGYDVRESPAADRAQLEAVHPPGYVDEIEEICPPGRRRLDMDTVVSARVVGGGAARGRRRGRDGRRARWAARRATAPRCTARPATTPSRRGRWASACSTTSPSRRGTRSTTTGSSGC